ESARQREVIPLRVCGHLVCEIEGGGMHRPTGGGGVLEVVEVRLALIGMFREALPLPPDVPCCYRDNADAARLVRCGEERRPSAEAVPHDRDAPRVEVILRPVCPHPRENGLRILESVPERERPARAPRAALVEVNRVEPGAPHRLRKIEVLLVTRIP